MKRNHLFFLFRNKLMMHSQNLCMWRTKKRRNHDLKTGQQTPSGTRCAFCGLFRVQMCCPATNHSGRTSCAPFLISAAFNSIPLFGSISLDQHVLPLLRARGGLLRFARLSFVFSIFPPPPPYIFFLFNR